MSAIGLGRSETRTHTVIISATPDLFLWSGLSLRVSTKRHRPRECEPGERNAHRNQRSRNLLPYVPYLSQVGDMQLLPTIISASSVLVAAFSAYASYRSSRAARRGLVANSLIASIGDMIAALHSLESEALRLDRMNDVGRSREVLREHFDLFQTANSKVDLLVASTGGAPGEWVRAVANNMAVDLLQADECSQLPMGLPMSDSELGRGWAEGDLTILRQSIGYKSMVAHDQTLGSIEGSVPLKDWWAPKVLQNKNWYSVYSIDASYVVQHARILSEFMDQHLEPWARDLIRKRLK